MNDVRVHTFLKSTAVSTTAEALFVWHEAPGAFERLTPPWERVRVLKLQGGIRDGATISLAVGRWPFALRWEIEHRDYTAGRSFTDVQIRGPFVSWTHLHRMIPDGTSCLLEDRIDYVLPFGWLGAAIGGPFIKDKLKRMFDYRHNVTRRAFMTPDRANARG